MTAEARSSPPTVTDVRSARQWPTTMVAGLVAASVGLLATWWLVATQAWVGRLDAAVVQDAASDRVGWLTPLVLRFTDLAGTTLLPVLVGLAAAVLVGMRRMRAAAACPGARRC